MIGSDCHQDAESVDVPTWLPSFLKWFDLICVAVSEQNVSRSAQRQELISVHRSEAGPTQRSYRPLTSDSWAAGLFLTETWACRASFLSDLFNSSKPLLLGCATPLASSLYAPLIVWVETSPEQLRGCNRKTSARVWRMRKSEDEIGYLDSRNKEKFSLFHINIWFLTRNN